MSPAESRSWLVCLTALLLIAALAPAEEDATGISLSGVNTANLGTGSVRTQFGDDAHVVYRENVLDVDAAWNDIVLNVAAAVYHPAEFPADRTDEALRVSRDAVIRRYLEWRGPVTLRLGNAWTTFGNGLALSLYRDETLDNPLLLDPARVETPTTWDNSCDGLFVEVLRESWGLKALAGSSDYYGNLQAANAEVYTAPVTMGASWVSADAVVQSDTPDRLELDNREIYVAGAAGPVEFSVNHLDQHQRDQLDRNAGAGGLATYSTLGGPLFGWFLQLEHKYYRFAGGDPRFNNPPIVQREIPTRLIARKRRQNTFEDEVGLQLDVSRYFEDGPELSFSAAWASHIDDGAYLPLMEQRYAAYQEYTAGWDYAGEHDRHLVLAAAYAEEAKPDPGEWTRRGGLGASLSTPVPLLRSMEWSSEVMFKRDRNPVRTGLAALVWTDVFPVRDFSLNLTADYEEHSGAGRDWMFSTELRWDFRLGDYLRNSITLFAGRQRGGLVCSSGNCRNVPPFNGVKAALRTQF